MIHQHQNGDEGQAGLGELDRIHIKPVDLSACRVAYCFSFRQKLSASTPLESPHLSTRRKKILLNANNRLVFHSIVILEKYCDTWPLEKI